MKSPLKYYLIINRTEKKNSKSQQKIKIGKPNLK